jgi:hypothetical protein
LLKARAEQLTLSSQDDYDSEDEHTAIPQKSKDASAKKQQQQHGAPPQNRRDV